MLSILIRQRRRVILFTSCLLLASLLRLGYSPFVLPFVIPGIGIPALVMRYAPDLRRVIEAIGLGTLVIAAMPTPAVSLVPLIPAASYVAFHLLYGTWSDR